MGATNNEGRYSSFCHCSTGAKDFVWLARMLYHRADHTNAVIGGDNSQTRSPWRVQVKWLTKICCYLICSPIHPRLLGDVGFNLALGLVTSCCSCQTAWRRPACCWLGWGFMSIGDPSKSHLGVSRAIKNSVKTNSIFHSFCKQH